MWFTETAWPPIIGVSVLAVLLFLGWLRQRRLGFLAGVAFCIALCGILWVLELQIVTERERVEQRLIGLAETFQQESMQCGLANLVVPGGQPRTLNFVSASANDVRSMVEAALKLVDIADDVRISDIHTTLSNNNSRATTRFRASATVTVGTYGNVGRQSTRWELTWQREQDEWQVRRATRLHFLTGEPLQNPFAARE